MTRVVLLVLKSPLFLYRYLEGGCPDGYEVASRLSFGLWDSIPDATLMQAAAAGRLATRDQVTQQAERMVCDLRARHQGPRFLPPMAQGRSGPRPVQGPQAVPGVHPGGRLRPADLA